MNSKLNIFISHARADAGQKKDDVWQLNNEAKALCEALCEIVPAGTVTFSSNSENALAPGVRILRELHDKIVNADLCIAFITDNYLRSQYCIYELCLMKAYENEKDILIIFSNPKVFERTSTDLATSGKICYIIQDKNYEDIIKQITSKSRNDECNNIKEVFCSKKTKDALRNYLAFLVHNDNEQCIKPFVGQTQDEYNAINRYAVDTGIQRIAFSGVYKKTELDSHIQNANKVYCVSTTGASLLKGIKDEILPKALQKECFEFHMILPWIGSQVTSDVAESECFPYKHEIDDMSLFLKMYFPEKEVEEQQFVIFEQNKRRIYEEYKDVLLYLNQSMLKAKEMAYQQDKTKSQRLGKIIIHDSRTLLRQTILLTVRDEEIWGWIRMTMPPLLSIDSPDLLFQCDNIDSKYMKKLGSVILEHCKCLVAMDTLNFEINGNTAIEEIVDKHHNSKFGNFYWEQKFNEADKPTDNTPILIEVAAQHPLTVEGGPASEFMSRLDMAVKLYREFRQKDQIVKLFVPGSIHKQGDLVDPTSLCEAGIGYLKTVLSLNEQNDILSDQETNLLYMGKHGVYNSMDECYVACQIYKNHLLENNQKFGRLFCVCSPNQVMRKTFVYLYYGIYPMCYSVPTNNMYHNPVSEFFHSLNNVVYSPDNWHEPGNETFKYSRQQRNPNKP